MQLARGQAQNGAEEKPHGAEGENGKYADHVLTSRRQ
jgi:hypothetical protein